MSTLVPYPYQSSNEATKRDFEDRLHIMTAASLQPPCQSIK